MASFGPLLAFASVEDETTEAEENAYTVVRQDAGSIFPKSFIVGNLVYRFIYDEAEVTGLSTNAGPHVVIPAEVLYGGKKYRVTSLAEGAFSDSKIRSVVIPSSVTTVGSRCFYGCGNLSDAVIADGVEELGDRCFCGAALRHVSIPASMRRLGSFCFWNNAELESVHIADGLQHIGSSCFFKCDKLAQINLPYTLLSLGDACLGRTSLTSVTIPMNVRHIGLNITGVNPKMEWIEVDGRNPHYDSRNNCNAIIETETRKMVLANHRSTVPAGVKSLGSHCFAYAHGLTSIELPEGLERLDQISFWDCPNLTTVVLPASLKSIGRHCFSNCRSLRTIVCKAATPPAFFPLMENVDMERVELMVPKKALKAYKKANVWNVMHVRKLPAGWEAPQPSAGDGYGPLEWKYTTKIVNDTEYVPESKAREMNQKKKHGKI